MLTIHHFWLTVFLLSYLLFTVNEISPLPCLNTLLSFKSSNRASDRIESHLNDDFAEMFIFLLSE